MGKPRGRVSKVRTDSPLSINFDHSYWEFGYSKEYNFIEAANKAGYAVLTYDRLGRYFMIMVFVSLLICL
jgi:hypothetical protein